MLTSVVRVIAILLLVLSGRIIASLPANAEEQGDNGLIKPGYAGSPESESFGDPSSDSEKHKSAPTKRRFFKGFGAYRTRFAKLCAEFTKDGQRNWIAETAKHGARYERECKPCRSLYVVIASACPSAVSARVKAVPTQVVDETSDEEIDEAAAEEGNEASEDETAIKKQVTYFEPNLRAIDIILDCAREMADDSDSAEDNLRALRQLTDKMRDKSDKSAAAISYFDIVAAYFLEPFRARGMLSTPISVEGGGSDKKRPKVNLEELF